MITKEQDFVQQFSRFKQLAAHGERVEVEDRIGARFVFMLLPPKQRPPRRAARAPEGKLFQDVDWDEPAMPAAAWEANR